MNVHTIYICCLVGGFVFTLLTFFLGHFFGHAEHVDGSGGHAEAGADNSDMPGVSIFSPTIIACFITAFGGFGTIFSQIPLLSNPVVSAPLSVLTGVLVAGLLYKVLSYVFDHSQASSESRLSQIAGTDASIISPIPENGVGEIAYVVGGTRYTAPARTERGVPVGNGKLVKITRVVGTQFYVELAS